jgi:hypothetical protein
VLLLIGFRNRISVLLDWLCVKRRLYLTLVAERRRPRSHHLAHRVARDVQVPGDLLDRAAADEELAPDARNRIHALHPPAASPNARTGSLPNHG